MKLDKSVATRRRHVYCRDENGSWHPIADLPSGHRFYSSPVTMKRPPLVADNDNYNSRSRPCTWPTVEASDVPSDVTKMVEFAPGKFCTDGIRPPMLAGAEYIRVAQECGGWLTSRTKHRAVKSVEPETDAQYWLGSRYAAANDNRVDRRWKGEENHGPDEDYAARRDNPGTSRSYEGDILSRLVAEGDVESAFVLRQVARVLSMDGLVAANDNNASEADVEIIDGFGLDYAMEQDSAESVIEAYQRSGKVPEAWVGFRQRSGAGGCSLTAQHRADERSGQHAWRYIGLTGPGVVLSQEYESDGQEPWRSHAKKNGEAARELAAACDNTDWRRVTWTRYAPMPARGYGDLAIFSRAKGTGEGGTTAPEHSAVGEIRRSQDAEEFRSHMSPRALHLVEHAAARLGYSGIAAKEGLSRNGAKRAIRAALAEAWSVLSRITGEQIPERKEKLAA